jgi:hypothetical protein
VSRKQNFSIALPRTNYQVEIMADWLVNLFVGRLMR